MLESRKQKISNIVSISYFIVRKPAGIGIIFSMEINKEFE